MEGLWRTFLGARERAGGLSGCEGDEFGSHGCVVVSCGSYGQEVSRFDMISSTSRELLLHSRCHWWRWEWQVNRMNVPEASTNLSE